MTKFRTERDPVSLSVFNNTPEAMKSCVPGFNVPDWARELIKLSGESGRRIEYFNMYGAWSVPTQLAFSRSPERYRLAGGVSFVANEEALKLLDRLVNVTESLLQVVRVQNGNLHADINQMQAEAETVLQLARSHLPHPEPDSGNHG